MEPFVFESRTSDSPLIDSIWRTTSGDGGTFISIAQPNVSLVVTRQRGKTWVSLMGPETVATCAAVPDHAEFFGIVFKLGTYLPHLPTRQLVDAHVELPAASANKVWMRGAVWELPTFENADTFVSRLIRDGSLSREPSIADVISGRMPELSVRTLQRRFVHAAGISQGTMLQIGRARHALELLERGTSILDVVALAGYSDQPHLTRAVRLYTGQTPAQILRAPAIRSG